MLRLLEKHSLIAICLAVLLEELGIPMPIPTDLLIVLAGAEGAPSTPRLVLWFVLLSIASATGATGLYMICRRGGRPLVERYGKYVHIGPKQLERGERLLARTGWFGIAIGRAVPGLRYVTVIACGVLNVPYWKFVTAHLFGSSVYIATFLALGAIFGPTVAEWLHTPTLELRLLWLIVLAIGQPLLFGWLYYRSRENRPAEPSRRRVLGSILLASFAGTAALSAAWAMAAAIAALAGSTRSLNLTISLAHWLLGRGLRAPDAYLLVYAGLLLICLTLSVLYYEFMAPRLASHRISMPRQILSLSLLGAILFGGVFVLSLMVERNGALARWWMQGGPLVALATGIGIVCFACTVAFGRELAITVLPSLRRSGPDDPPGDEPPAVCEPEGPAESELVTHEAEVRG